MYTADPSKICTACSNLGWNCATCTKDKCLTCDTGNYMSVD